MTTESCVHWWMLDDPGLRPMEPIAGTCKQCGAFKVFTPPELDDGEDYEAFVLTPGQSAAPGTKARLW